MSFYSKSCIWPDAMDLTKGRLQILCRFGKMFGGDAGNDKTSFRGRKVKPCTESPNWERPKMDEIREGQSREHAHYFV
jgi:hypothetical protein